MEDEMTILRPVSPDHYEYAMNPMENSVYPPGAEDTRELERSILGPSQFHDSGMSHQPIKRQATGAESDGSSDLEVPIAMRRDKFGHATKKRKVDHDAADTADELERSFTGARHSASPGKPGPSAVAKGKGKQIPLRDDTPDSISATPKVPRKKLGPRKKLDNLPPETLELLGLGSAPTSVYGDVTPNVSRPASPALTATSNVVYELDEAVPPLKRAKKVDDAAMLKRVKALEEAQRKVWTNIAKRDVAKVRTII
jgi:DNA helicase INO80